MANHSYANGVYSFDFTEANPYLTSFDKLKWLKKVSHLLCYQELDSKTPVTYSTSMGKLLDSSYKETQLLKELEDDVVDFDFYGYGRWDYETNVYFFNQEPLKYLIEEIDGIKIDVEYTDFEPAEAFVGNGHAKISFNKKEGIVIEASFNKENLTLDTWREYDLGDDNQYFEFFPEEAEQEA